MKQILSWLITAAVLAGETMVTGTVTFVGNDLTTDAKWRTATVAKPNDMDSDNIYGSAGYYLASGKRGGYKDQFLSNNQITGASNPDDINTLPAYLLSLEFADKAEIGRSWGGDGANFGTMDKVTGSAGLTGAAILKRGPFSDPLRLILKRTNSPAFRLTLIMGNNPNEAGFNDPGGQNVTVDDGSGAVVQMTGDPGLTRTVGYTTYQSWDISAGSSNIEITMVGLPEGTGIGRLSGLAIDIQTVNPAVILVQPTGSTNLVNTPGELAVAAGGTKPSFQWYKNGAVLLNETNASLLIPKLAGTDAGSYYVVVSNAVAKVTSDTVILSVVNSLPTRLATYQTTVKQQPSLISLYSFDARDASDTQALNNGTLTGKTSFSEGIGGGAAKALVLDGGGHVSLGQVEAFDFADTTGSVEAWVRADWTTIGYNPCLFADRNGGPVNWSIHMDANKQAIGLWNGTAYRTFNIAAAGTNWHYFAVVFDNGSFTIYWDGKTLGTLDNSIGLSLDVPTQIASSVEAVTTEGWVGGLDEVAFYADALGAEVLLAHYAVYAVGDPPLITQQPQGGAFLAGIALNLGAVVTGAEVSYQWYKNGSAIGGGTNPVYTIPALTAADSGPFQVVVKNLSGSVTSQIASVSVATALPAQLMKYQAALKQETSLISLYSFDALNADDSTGANPGTLAGWPQFAEGIGGGAAKGLLLDGGGRVNLGQVEAFDFADGSGSVSAWIRADWSSISYNPCLFSDRNGGPVNWSIHMNANKQAVGLWNGTAYRTFAIADAGTNWHHFKVVFDNGSFSIYWDGLALGTQENTIGSSMESPTQISSSSESSTAEGWVGAMDEVAFFADALTAEAVQTHYAAYASGITPVILVAPASGVYLAGSPLVLSVSAQGAQMSYQWLINGQAIAGASNATFSIVSARLSDAGAYRVKVTNPGGSVESTEAVITIVTPDLAKYQSAVRNEANLISYYPFDKGDATDSKSNNNGALEGDAQFVTGVGNGLDKAVSLNGAGHVALGQVADFDFADGSGTVEAWIRADWTASPGYNPAIFADRDGGLVNWSIHMLQAKDQLAHWNGSAVSLLAIPNASFSWHHLAITFDAANWSVYWDGELAGTAVQLMGTAPESPTQLGSSSAAPTAEGWIGLLDEVAFYGDVLPATAIRNHYQALAGAPKTAKLNFTRSGPQLTLFWDAELSGYILESTGKLPATTWTPVEGVVNNRLTVSTTGGPRFYRLRKP